MKPGSVMVDLAVERGGNVEGAEPGKVAEVGGVKIVGFTNVAGRIPASASAALRAEPLRLRRDDDRQGQEGARGQLGRRAGQGHRPDARRQAGPFRLQRRRGGRRKEVMSELAAIDPFIFQLSILRLAIFSKTPRPWPLDLFFSAFATPQLIGAARSTWSRTLSTAWIRELQLPLRGQPVGCRPRTHFRGVGTDAYGGPAAGTVWAALKCRTGCRTSSCAS